MRSKLEIIKEIYDVETMEDARDPWYEDMQSAPMPPVEEWVKLKLPYKADGSPDRPSIAEIEKAMKENRITRGLIDVCRIGNSVVKRGYCRRILHEAENMLFLRKHTEVRTPKVYEAFINMEFERTLSKEIQINFVIMEYVEGISLDQDKYKELDKEARKLLRSRLGQQFQLLRSVPAPAEEYFGRIFRQGWNPRMPFLHIRCREMCGPYKTSDDFISALYANTELRMSMRSYNSPEWTSEVKKFLSKFKPTLGRTKEHKPVLAHMDAKLQNIIARPIKGEGGEIKDWEVTLIDWDTLAWVPGWVQYASLYERLWFWDEPKGMRDELLGQVFEPMGNFNSYSKEYDFFKEANRELGFGFLGG